MSRRGKERAEEGRGGTTRQSTAPCVMRCASTALITSFAANYCPSVPTITDVGPHSDGLAYKHRVPEHVEQGHDTPMRVVLRSPHVAEYVCHSDKVAVGGDDTFSLLGVPEEFIMVTESSREIGAGIEGEIEGSGTKGRGEGKGDEDEEGEGVEDEGMKLRGR